MGNRAIVRFPDNYDSGIEVYLHWHADYVKDWLKEIAPRMRKGDASYAAARFIGHCHENISGGLSLGVMPINSCDDGVIYVVDCNTGRVTCDYGRNFTIKMGEF